jgi:hypothetical protein
MQEDMVFKCDQYVSKKAPEFDLIPYHFFHTRVRLELKIYKIIDHLHNYSLSSILSTFLFSVNMYSAVLTRRSLKKWTSLRIPTWCTVGMTLREWKTKHLFGEQPVYFRFVHNSHFLISCKSSSWNKFHWNLINALRIVYIFVPNKTFQFVKIITSVNDSEVFVRKFINSIHVLYFFK